MTGAERPAWAEIVLGVVASPRDVVQRPAVVWAALEARRRRTSLRLVTAVDDTQDDTADDTADDTPSIDAPQIQAADAGTARAAAVLEETRRFVRRIAPTVLVAARRIDGPPADVLVEESGRAALVVLGADVARTTPAHGAFGHLDAGSTTGEVLTRASCPVVVIRHQAVLGAAGVLVGDDGSPAAMSAVVAAAQEAQWRRSLLTVLRITHDGHDPATDWTVDADTVVDVLRRQFPGLAVVCRAHHGDPVARTLLEAAARYDLLALGVGRHAGPGSVARAVLDRARGPVLFAPVPDRPPLPGLPGGVRELLGPALS